MRLRLRIFGVHEEQAKSALSENKSPDVGFRWSVNPYRGCFHGCAYCYARPTHPYLGFGAGTDFERQIVVKVNIVDRLRARLRKKSWNQELIAFSGNTDCYQPIEAHYQLTRRCLELCAEYQTPVTIITKGKLVRRDVDVLQTLQRRSACRVTLSIPFANDDHARAIEPFASPPSKRFETLRTAIGRRNRHGRGGRSDHSRSQRRSDPGGLETRPRCRCVRARSRFSLRLPLEVGPVFSARLAEAFPLRHAKIMSALRDMRGGQQSDARFGARMVGLGPRWAMIEKLFSLHCDDWASSTSPGKQPSPHGAESPPGAPTSPPLLTWPADCSPPTVRRCMARTICSERNQVITASYIASEEFGRLVIA